MEKEPLWPCVKTDPILLARMIESAPSFPEDCARDVADVADRTVVGERRNWARILGGAAAGLVVGVVLRSVVGRR
jgi:hypothetical protein